ncbi:MAG: hypothetical protein E6J14_10730 [Chloroflexi bacterium]|nr:MAG: hypothetical protein E6J14_10730 [Chloroflexota bacterium]
MVYRRVGRLLLGAAGFAGLVGWGPATSVVAAPSGGGCQLQGTASFSPGLTNTAQNFNYNFTGALSGCQSNVPGAPTSGTVQAGKTVTVPYNWTYTDSTTLSAASLAGATTISTVASELVGEVITIDAGTAAETRTVTAVSGAGPFTETLSSALANAHAAGAAVSDTHSGSATATYQEPVPAGNGSCGTSTTSGTAVVTWADNTTSVVTYTTTGAAAAVHLTGTVAVNVNDSLASFTGPTQAPPAATFTETTTRYANDGALGALTFQPPDPTACGGAGVTTAGISGFVGLGAAS